MAKKIMYVVKNCKKYILFLHLFVYFGYIIIHFDYLGHIIKIFVLGQKKVINCIKRTYYVRKFQHTIFWGTEIKCYTCFIIHNFRIKSKN